MARNPRPLSPHLAILFGFTLVGVGALTTVASVWHHFGHAISRGPIPVAGARTLEITLTDFSFSPQLIAVRTGEPTNLRLVNIGEELHDFTVAARRIHRATKPKETVTIGLHTDRPGEFEFYCSVTGHRERGMVGRIVVQPQEERPATEP
ncbi:MAG: cupredoxin domain-containing protein [bacterium]